MPPNGKKRRLDKKESNIVIVGGGLAGLSAALALERAGFHLVDLFERDESFDQQKEGYGLTLNYNPKGPLAALGILEDVALQDCPSRSHYLFRADGSIIGYFGNAFSKHRGAGQRGNLRVPRKTLRRMLMEKLQCTTIHWGHRFLDYDFDSSKEKYTIRFSNAGAMGSTKVVADLLVAADGIRSAILSKIYHVHRSCHAPPEGNMQREILSNSTAVNNKLHPSRPNEIGLRHTNVRLILGIAEFTHPLLYERGFYTLDGKHRLFTMPLSTNRFDQQKKNRIMWQLSFSLDCTSKPLDATSLLDYVLETCKTWHDPVLAMLKSTSMETIWGTDLMDRDPKKVQQMIEECAIKRLVVVGDALHTMTPFKGQGANQALSDGSLLADCMQRGAIDSAVRMFWREAVHRTSPIVQASRLAAQNLHSPGVLKAHGFAGIKPSSVEDLLEKLRQKNIGPSLAEKLDSEISKVVQDIQAAEEGIAKPPNVEEQRLALEYAKCGDTPSLRLQSLRKQSESIRTAKDDQGRGCLHWAVLGGHYGSSMWLMSEVDCDTTALDAFGKTAGDYATAHPDILALF